MIILDTCVVSEAIRPSPSPRVLDWLDQLPEERVYLPSLVFGELQKGVELLEEGKKQYALRLWLEQLAERFHTRTLTFDKETAIRWGMLTARLEKSGHPLPVIDSMLAATALRYSALLATRNTGDFEGTGVKIADPWEGPLL